MQRRIGLRFVVSVFLALVLLVSSVGVAAAARPPKDTAPKVPVALDQLQPGDVVFMRNPSDLWSGQTYWTHNGLYIGAYQGDNGRGVQVNYKYAIIEAISPKVTILDLSNTSHWYYSKTYSVGVKRFSPNGANDSVTAAAAAKLAQSYRGLAYEFPLFTTYGGKDTANALYCSELVWRAYRDVTAGAVNLDSTPNTLVWGKDVVTPDDLYNSPMMAQLGTPTIRYAPLAQ